MRATRASQGDCLLYIVRDHIHAMDQAIYPQASHPWLPEEALIAMQDLSLFVSLLLLPPPPSFFLVDDFPNLCRLLLWHCRLPCLLFIVPQKCHSKHLIAKPKKVPLQKQTTKSEQPMSTQAGRIDPFYCHI